jgi:hypothetical protein
MMSGWTEYRAGDEWPAGDNFKWEVRLDGAWTETDTPFDDWDTGLRVRYREREVKMVKIHYTGVKFYQISGGTIHEWVRLAAPIAAYHKSMKYMACDADGQVSVCSEKHKISVEYEWWIRNGEAKFICDIPKEAMPADWKTAIVELVHGGEKND